MGYELILDDVLRWAAGYTGDPFHCLFCDPPYHLTITKRFGKPGSKPAKAGVYNRASKGFMNQSWDGTDESGLGIAFRPETWAALSQHLHPGGFILAFAGTRGYHRMACAMEGNISLSPHLLKSWGDALAIAQELNDWEMVKQVEESIKGAGQLEGAMREAGLIIHPAMIWVNLSGFCKATRIDTQVDKMSRREYVQAAIDLGLEIPGNSLHDWTKAEHAPGDKWWSKFKEVLSEEQWQAIERRVIGQSQGSHQVGIPLPGQYDGQRQYLDLTAPATPLAQTWAGHRYGLQALKPALEFIAVAQKPYEGRPVDCITRTGAGAFNIDAARIAADDSEWTQKKSASSMFSQEDRPWKDRLNGDEEVSGGSLGRWPANLLLDEAGSALLDAQSGESVSREINTTQSARPSQLSKGAEKERVRIGEGYNDSGGASRMFFQSSWQYEILEQLENADPLKYEPKVSSLERSAGLGEVVRLRSDLSEEQRVWVLAELEKAGVRPIG